MKVNNSTWIVIFKNSEGQLRKATIVAEDKFDVWLQMKRIFRTADVIDAVKVK